MTYRTHCVVDEEITVSGHLPVLFRGSLDDCEDWVAEREKIDPKKVHRGGYGIDGPQRGEF